jgi:phosphoglycolate phosphatase
MAYRNILFDLGGTLTDPKVGIFNSIRYALRGMNIKAPEEDQLLSFIGPLLFDSFKHHFSLTDEVDEEAVGVVPCLFSWKRDVRNSVN